MNTWRTFAKSPRVIDPFGPEIMFGDAEDPNWSRGPFERRMHFPVLNVGAAGGLPLFYVPKVGLNPSVARVIGCLQFRIPPTSLIGRCMETDIIFEIGWNLKALKVDRLYCIRVDGMPDETLRKAGCHPYTLMYLSPQVRLVWWLRLLQCLGVRRASDLGPSSKEGPPCGGQEMGSGCK